MEAPRLRDVDAAERMVRLQSAMWGGMIGLVGIPISLLLAEKVGAQPPVRYLFLLGGPLAGFLVYFISTRVTEGGAHVMSRIHNPSGDSTPAIREYSKPQALVMAGHYREAVEEYEDLVTLYPDDPEPYLRIARLLRDKLNEPDEAVQWFKRARAQSHMDAGREILVTQEIIELYRRSEGEQRRAIPELARLLERFPDHPSADGLRRELQDLRRGLIENDQ